MCDWAVITIKFNHCLGCSSDETPGTDTTCTLLQRSVSLSDNVDAILPEDSNVLHLYLRTRLPSSSVLGTGPRYHS